VLWYLKDRPDTFYSDWTTKLLRLRFRIHTNQRHREEKMKQVYAQLCSTKRTIKSAWIFITVLYYTWLNLFFLRNERCFAILDKAQKIAATSARASFPLLEIQVSVVTIWRPTLIYSKSMATNRWAKGNKRGRGRYSNGPQIHIL